MGNPRLTIRIATGDDIETLVGLINRAFAPERIFLDRDRIDQGSVRELLTKGTFLVGETSVGSLATCVYMEQRGDRGYFSLLAVDAASQRSGLGRRMISAIESHFRSVGCHALDLRVINLRAELVPFYHRLGFAERGVEPFEDPNLRRPAHFILMSKAL
jgi:ribosomal protein S18 acetylase RimI-like enzyme